MKCIRQGCHYFISAFNETEVHLLRQARRVKSHLAFNTVKKLTSLFRMKIYLILDNKLY